ncbi:hypothetical protein KAX75_01120, partial [candidate division WOR-3 bacterium]|nr:hypothetical protein [candidate division WOR-3 bacterium]
QARHLASLSMVGACGVGSFMECNDGVIAKKIVIASILLYSLPKQSQCWGQAPTLLSMIVNMIFPRPTKGSLTITWFTNNLHYSLDFDK